MSGYLKKCLVLLAFPILRPLTMNSALQSRYCLEGRPPGTWLFSLTPAWCKRQRPPRKKYRIGTRYLSDLPPGFDTRKCVWRGGKRESKLVRSSQKILDSVGILHFWGTLSTKQWLQLSKIGIAWWCGRSPGSRQFSIKTPIWYKRQTGTQKTRGGGTRLWY